MLTPHPTPAHTGMKHVGITHSKFPHVTCAYSTVARARDTDCRHCLVASPHLETSELGEVRLEVVDDAVSRARQRQTSHQQHEQDDIGETRRKDNHLQHNNNKHSDVTGGGHLLWTKQMLQNIADKYLKVATLFCLSRLCSTTHTQSCRYMYNGRRFMSSSCITLHFSSTTIYYMYIM